jgi:predicted ArsR family transcriptional regulator
VVPEQPPGALPRAQAALWRVLRGRSAPASLAELADVTGSHENTVREQLLAMLRAGAVRRHLAKPSGRGRPAWLYEATGDDRAAGAREYAGLAVTLAAFLSENSTSPWSDAVAAGKRWGRDLGAGAAGAARAADADRPAEETRREDGKAGTVAVLEQLGFAPQAGADADVVRLTRCPLLDAARRYPDVVCGIHLGLVKGALDEQGAASDAVRLTPFAEPGACLLDLPATPGATAWCPA